MTGAVEGHNIIQGNMFATLLAKLRGGPCRPFASGMAMKTGLRNGRYLGVTVDCGARNPANRSLPKPTVVFEILSPDTQREDRSVKLWEYNELRSVDFYVLVEQSLPLVLVYSRSAAGEFNLKPLELLGLDGTIGLPTINNSLTMAEIYEGLDFDAKIRPDAPPPTGSPWAW
jgi:Uma2 family endonuclease